MYVTIAVLASRLSSNIKRHLKCYVCDQNNTRLLTFKQYKKAFEILCDKNNTGPLAKEKRY